MDDEFLINIWVAGRRFPMTIRRDEEESFRVAAKLIDQKILKYRDKYGTQLDTQSLLALIALQSYVEQIDLEKKSADSFFETKIRDLNGELETYLKNT